MGRAFLVALLQTIVCQVDGSEGSCGSKLIGSVLSGVSIYIYIFIYIFIWIWYHQKSKKNVT